MTFLLLASLAWADAIGPEPEDCPPGSRGESSHAGEWCEATTCSSEADCNEGSCTEQVGLCVDVQEWGCGGMRSETAEPCTFTVNEALGLCDDDSDCTRGSCVIADRCVDGPLNQARANCGCSAVTPLSAGLGVMLLALAGLLGRRP